MLAPIFLLNFSHLTLWILASCAIPRILSNTILDSSTLSLMFTSTCLINDLQYATHHPSISRIKCRLTLSGFPCSICEASHGAETEPGWRDVRQAKHLQSNR